VNFHDAATALLSYVFQSGLLLAVGLLLPRILRLRHPRTLLVYWRILLVVVILLPLLPLAWPRQTSLPILTLEGMTVESVVVSALPESVPGLSWQLVILVTTAITTLGILRLAMGIAYLNRCRRRSLPLTPTPDSVSAVQEMLALDVPFLVSDRLTAPVTFGWLRPSVLLPASFKDLSPDQQEGVACHELLHVRRHDWPITFLEELLRTIMWFQPAVWFILPRIALSREQIVDTDTVHLTGKRRPYLDALWRVICSDRQITAAMAVPFLGGHDLIDRIAWLKKERHVSKARIVLSAIVLVVSLAIAGIVGAAVFSSDSIHHMSFNGLPHSDAPEKEKPKSDGEKLETVAFDGDCKDITHPVLIEKINPKYPPEAREERLMGTVIVRTVITEEGIVDAIEVVESDDARFSEAAVEAIDQWRFEPALCDGMPVGVYYHLTVNFRLE
jgi:TonB family protein